MPPRVVHLDQKDWIELARGYYGLTPQLQKIARNVVERSERGQAIFPLSITHLSETVRKMNPGKRQRLAEYMTLVSQGWAILPAPSIVRLEIEDACLRYLGRPGYDLQNLAIRKGLSQLAGQKATLVDRGPSNPPQKELKHRLIERIESPETLLLLMKHGLAQSQLEKLQEDASATVDKLEQIRSSDEGKVRDNNRRRNAILARYLINEIGPTLIAFLQSINVNYEILTPVLTDQERLIRFFQSMPTSYCDLQLTLYRDMQRMRKIQPNDLYDIMSLSIAIPYSDVVVTERMWQSAIIQTKIDKLRPTIILRSVRELAPTLGPN